MDNVGVFLAQCQGKRHVFVNGHMAVQRVALEHHCHITVLCRGRRDVLAVQQQLALGDILQTSHHAQGRGFAAARRADQHDQLAVLDIQVEVKDRLNTVVINLVDMLQVQRCHVSASLCTLHPEGFQML